MQVIEFTEFGGPEVLALARRPDPVPGPGEIVVDIRAASVNAADYKIRRAGSVQSATLPHVPGRDFSGVVSAVGPGADVAPGDAVFGVLPHGQEGAYAEKILVAAKYVTAVPKGLSHIEAAACALAGLTAMIGIEDCLNVQPGEKVLIQGGAGGVGGIAIQLARHRGAEVGATARAGNHDYLRQLGAGRTIDYRTEDIADVFGDCDAVYDCVGPETTATTFAALRPGGRAAFIGTGANPPPPPRADLSSAKPDVFRSRERMERLAAYLADGTLKLPQIETMPLAEARRAHELSEAGHVRGKIVLVPPG